MKLKKESLTNIPLKRSDAQLQHLVQEELRSDAGVREASVSVDVCQGIVTLTGTISSYSEQVAAQRAAHRVEGVLDVANALRIDRGAHPFSDDTHTAQSIRSALESDVRIPHQSIQVTVRQGDVTLEGTVVSYGARYCAEQAVQHISGICYLRNEIQVIPDYVSPADVRSTVEQALERHAAHRAKHIQIEIAEGVVTLTGAVRSWPEREAAFESVAHIPGVRSVVNHLEIQLS